MKNLIEWTNENNMPNPFDLTSREETPRKKATMVIVHEEMQKLGLALRAEKEARENAERVLEARNEDVRVLEQDYLNMKQQRDNLLNTLNLQMRFDG